MVRCKVRYLKTTFFKAEEWRKSTGAELDVNDGCSTIKEKLNKMCPHYDRFAELFGNKASSDLVVESSYSGSHTIANDPLTEPIGEYCCDEDYLIEEDTTKPFNSQNVSNVECIVEIAESSNSMHYEEDLQSKSNPKVTLPDARSFGQKMMSHKPKNALSELSEMQKKRDEYYEKRISIEKKKLELEREKMEKEFELKKIEFELKKNEFELKKNEFELKRNELEQKERLAVLELKYKYNKE